MKPSFNRKNIGTSAINGGCTEANGFKLPEGTIYVTLQEKAERSA